jgi:hypothetical protein
MLLCQCCALYARRAGWAAQPATQWCECRYTRASRFECTAVEEACRPAAPRRRGSSDGGPSREYRLHEYIPTRRSHRPSSCLCHLLAHEERPQHMAAEASAMECDCRPQWQWYHRGRRQRAACGGEQAQVGGGGGGQSRTRAWGRNRRLCCERAAGWCQLGAAATAERGGRVIY